MTRRVHSSLLFLLVLALAGCTTAPADSPANTSTTTTTTTLAPGGVTLKNGGSVTVAVPSLPTNFNPSAPPGANKITNEVMAAVWPRAFVTSDGFQQVAQPGFVESAEVYGLSPFTVVYKLNPKAAWSDGVPITAADFVYNWHEQLRWSPLLPDSGIVAGYRDIKSIASSDGGHTATIVFQRAFADWESLFSYLVPAHIAERYGWVRAFQGFDPAKVVSGSAFEIASFVPGQRLVLVRNPAYWSTPAHLTRIVLEVRSAGATLDGLRSGSVSLAEALPGPNVSATVVGAALGGIGLVTAISGSPTLWQICLNTGDPLLASTSVRRAIARSINRGDVTANSVGLLDWTATAADSRLTMLGQPGSPSGRSHIYNPLLALRLYALGGFVPGTDGAMRFGGNGPVLTLTLDVPRGVWWLAAAADSIQAQLRQIGVRLTMRPVSLPKLLDTILPGGGYQMALAPFLVTPYPYGMAAVYTPASSDASLPWQMTSAAWSRPGTEPGAAVGGVVTRDVSGLASVAVARRFEEAATNLNLDLANSLLGKANTQLWQDVPTIPLFQQPVELVRASDLVGVTMSPTWAGPFWDTPAWGIQVSPRVPPPSVPGVSGSSGSSGGAGVAGGDGSSGSTG